MSRNDQGTVNPLAATIDGLRGPAPEPDARFAAVAPAERYQFVRVVGEGGMGRVSEVLDRTFGRRVARKELLGASPNASGRFALEAIVTANLEHPGVPAVHDRGELQGGVPYYVMQLVEGRTLLAAIDACKTMRERLALVPAVVGVAQTLAYAHERGVVHRDVKPQNVVVGRHGQTVLLDWGIAKVRDVPETANLEPLRITAATGHDTTQAGEVFGTVGYMAPEQALGHVHDIDERTDVFALGALLYHVLAGRPPYQADSLPRALSMASDGTPPPLADLARDAPRGLCAIVETAMARDRASRYASASELARALEAYTADALGAEAGRWVEHVATGASVLSLVAAIVVLATVYRHVSFVEMGRASIVYTSFGAVGAVLSLLDLRTRGRHRLLPLAAGLGVASVLGAVAYASGGVIITLAGSAHAADPHGVLLRGLGESLGNVGWGATFAAFQAILWALARRGLAPHSPQSTRS